VNGPERGDRLPDPREDVPDDLPADPAAEPPAPEANVVRIEDEIDAPAALLTRMRHAAEARGDGRLYGAAARRNLKNFGAAMESATASPAERLGRRGNDVDPRALGGYSGAGRSARDPRGVGSVLDALVSGRGWKSPVAVGSVLSRWDELVGPGIAGHCRPESFDETVVRVRCDSTAYAANLRLMVPQLLRMFDEHLGEGIVTRIEILGPAAPSWKRGRRSVQGRGPRDTYG
jgi:predicted nucleic acid-binding Zn ribbon protein